MNYKDNKDKWEEDPNRDGRDADDKDDDDDEGKNDNNEKDADKDKDDTGYKEEYTYYTQRYNTQ